MNRSKTKARRLRSAASLWSRKCKWNPSHATTGQIINEPVYDTTNNLGFRQGPTQIQSQKLARSLKFRMKEEEGLNYPCSENKGADQLRGYREAGLRLCFRICRLLASQATTRQIIS